MSEPLIVDQGWFMGNVEGLHVVYMGAEINAHAFERYMRATCKEIDETPLQRKRGVFYEVPSPTSAGAARRRAVAEALHQRRAKLKAITHAYVLVTPSAVVRGMLTAVFWVAPPPYESKVAASEAEGFTWLAAHCPGIDADRALQAYLALRRRCLKDMLVAPPR
jgi:hypothetical protein